MQTRIACHFDREELQVFGSEGNFLLMRVFDDDAFGRLIENLEKTGIKVLNAYSFPMLRNTIRVSVGNPGENEAFLNCLFETLQFEFTLPESILAVA